MAEVRTNLTGNVDYAEFLVGVAVSAMFSGHLLEFTYADKRRVVEVHAVGLSTKDASLVLRGYQVEGDRDGWALYSMGKIEPGSAATIVGPVNRAPRDGYSMGDRQMRVVLAELVI